MSVRGVKRTGVGGTRSGADPAEAVRALAAAVASAMDTHRAEIAQGIVTRVVSEIDVLAGERPIVAAMAAGVDDHVASLARWVRGDVDAEPTALPAYAIEYARLLAQRGIAITILERGYRLGQDSVVRWCIDELGQLTEDAAVLVPAALAIMAAVSAHNDAESQHMLATYESEREAWLQGRSASRAARISDLLEGRPIEVSVAESTLGYRLGQHHLGLIVWTDRTGPADDDLAYLERAVTGLADHLGCSGRPLFEPRDEHTGWVWMPLGDAGQIDLTGLASIAAGWDRPVTVALGAPQEGVDGFARTHRQAAQAKVVARASRLPGPRVVPISEVGAVALMCSDLGAARSWVADVLGPLAADDPTAAQLRDTLRDFLASGGSYTATAAHLHMHKNSVGYRIHKAENLLGHSVREHRWDLETALALCQWLGAAVLSLNPEEPVTTR